MTDTPQWTWNDGWILMAVYLAGSGQGAQLCEIIATADATNHAIPTAAEMSSALTRFAQCGLIRQHAGKYSIVEEYLPAIEQAYKGRGGLFSSGEKGEKWLRKTRLPPHTTDCIGLSDADMQAAYDQYVQKYWKR